MFEKNYRLLGKHATYAKFLKDEAKIFDTIIGAYINGAIFGLLYNRTAPVDKESTDTANIMSEQFIQYQEKCKFVYRLVMLLDERTDIPSQRRIDRAFRDDAETENPNYEEIIKANMDVFHAYVRGGIEQLYEDFVTGCTSADDYITRMHEQINSFAVTLSDEAAEEKLAKLLK